MGAGSSCPNFVDPSLQSKGCDSDSHVTHRRVKAEHYLLPLPSALVGFSFEWESSDLELRGSSAHDPRLCEISGVTQLHYPSHILQSVLPVEISVSSAIDASNEYLPVYNSSGDSSKSYYV